MAGSDHLCLLFCAGYERKAAKVTVVVQLFSVGTGCSSGNFILIASSMAVVVVILFAGGFVVICVPVSSVNLLGT